MKTILFDLDGTLIDHFTTIARSIAYAQRKLGLPESSYEAVQAAVGGGINLTLTRLLGPDAAKTAASIFNEHFESNLFNGLEVLPGANWLLANLKASGQYKIAVFTNKTGNHSRRVVAHLKLDQWLDATIGTGDTPYRKPEPQFTAYMLELMDATSDETIMIGDSPFDFEAAEAGCLTSYLVTTGSHTREQLEEETAAAKIYNNLYELGADLFNLEPDSSTLGLTCA
jgi:phosphoglycolate phosphatase